MVIFALIYHAAWIVFLIAAPLAYIWFSIFLARDIFGRRGKVYVWLFASIAISLPVLWLASGFYSFISACGDSSGPNVYRTATGVQGVVFNIIYHRESLPHFRTDALEKLVTNETYNCWELISPGQQSYRLRTKQGKEYLELASIDFDSPTCSNYVLEAKPSRQPDWLTKSFHSAMEIKIRDRSTDEILATVTEQRWGYGLPRLYFKYFYRDGKEGFACGYMPVGGSFNVVHPYRSPETREQYLQADMDFITSVLRPGND